MTKEELVSELEHLYSDPEIPDSVAANIFAFKFGDEAIGMYTANELMVAAHVLNASIDEANDAELNAAFMMYDYFKRNPGLIRKALSGSCSSKQLPPGTARQLITYGAPGTGKSFRTKEETTGRAVYRTTFHPDSDYSTFVGAYKPTMSDDAGRIEVYKGSGSSKILDVTHEVKKGIAYEFVPQAFIKAYVDAWQKMSAPGGDGETGPIVDPVFLVIEEINRGNCAQIFGDLFQLLDRTETGVSDYPIDADADMKRYLARADVLGGLCLPNLVKCGVAADLAEEVIAGKKLALPPNLYIRATMNTSDQSLFPIDSAFKRRWEWKYVPIAKPTKEGWKDRVIVANGKAYDWWEFLLKVNGQILETTKSEDKQLGYFFVKAPDATGHIKADRFSGKVLFYLYNDVFKDYPLPPSLFGDGTNGSTKYGFKMFFDEIGEAKEAVVAAFLDQLGIPNTPLTPPDPEGIATVTPETSATE